MNIGIDFIAQGSSVITIRRAERARRSVGGRRRGGVGEKRQETKMKEGYGESEEKE